VDDHNGLETRSVFKHTESIKNELKLFLDRYKNFKGLEKDFNEIKIVKQRKIDQVEEIKAKLKELERDILKHNNEMEIITEKIEKFKTSHLVLSKSIEELGINELLQEEKVAQLKKNIEKHFIGINPKNDKECVLEYTSDEGKGLFYWLGTSGGTTEFKNPLDQELVNVTSSGPIYNGNRSLFEFHLACHTIYFNPGDVNSNFTIDLLNHRISPTNYALRAACQNENHATGSPRNWDLEGSVDGNIWTTLSQHKNDTKLAKVMKGTASWILQNPKQEQFRFIRFKQTGNTEYVNPSYLIFGGIEIYGTVRNLQ